MVSSVATSIRAALGNLPKAERKVARTLLDDYPAAGFQPVARLAGEAGVSAPTVLRLTERLGFRGYPEFQRALREELQHRQQSPLDQYESTADDQDPVARARRSLTQCVQRSFDLLDQGEFDRAVELLASSRRRVFATGGRFSSLVARSLVLHLEIVRPSVLFLSAEDRTSMLMDFGSRDLVFVVDLRRYQRSTLEFTRQAVRRGSKIILLTDQWQSPLSADADVVLTTALDAPSPFDSLVGAEAVVEAVVAGVIDQLGDIPKARMKAYDEAWGPADVPHYVADESPHDTEKGHP